jgi:hypothetical protein
MFSIIKKAIFGVCLFTLSSSISHLGAEANSYRDKASGLNFQVESRGEQSWDEGGYFDGPTAELSKDGSFSQLEFSAIVNGYSQQLVVHIAAANEADGLQGFLNDMVESHNLSIIAVQKNEERATNGQSILYLEADGILTTTGRDNKLTFHVMKNKSGTHYLGIVYLSPAPIFHENNETVNMMIDSIQFDGS